MEWEISAVEAYNPGTRVAEAGETQAHSAWTTWIDPVHIYKDI